MCRVVLVLLAILTSSVVRAGPIWTIHLRDDLDADALVARFGASLDEAEHAETPLIVLRLSGDGARPDIVARLIPIVQDASVRVVAYLHDEADHRVGAGQLMLALAVDRCMVHPDTTILAGPSEDLSSLGPDETDWLAVRHALSGRITPFIEARGLDPRLAEAIASARRPMWLKPTGEVATVLPRDEAWFALVTLDATGSTTFQISGARAIEHAIIDGASPSIRSLIRDEGLAGVSVRSRDLDSGLHDAHFRTTYLLRLIDEALVMAADFSRTGLDEPAARRRARAAEAYREAESLAERYPEILRLPAPGQTRVGQTPATTRNAWRKAFQQRRDALDE